MFRAALELGYEILEPGLPLRRVRGCANKHWTMDLLLVQSSLLLAWARDNKVDIPNINTEYRIVLMDGDYELDLPSEGIKIETLRAGDGVTFPAPGQRVTCHYELRLEGGQQVDSSRDRGAPLSFTLGRQEVIPGWERGIARMSLGQRARITVPSELGYGDRGSGPIPGGATLIFDVELLRIQ